MKSRTTLHSKSHANYLPLWSAGLLGLSAMIASQLASAQTDRGRNGQVTSPPQVQRNAPALNRQAPQVNRNPSSGGSSSGSYGSASRADGRQYGGYSGSSNGRGRGDHNSPYSNYDGNYNRGTTGYGVPDIRGDYTRLNSPSFQNRSENPYITRHSDVTYSARNRRFDNSSEGFGFKYNNGVRGRDAFYFSGGFGNFYFSSGCAYYPYYYDDYVYGLTWPSLYSGYYGAFPPYIAADALYFLPPRTVYVPYPVYTDGEYHGYRSDDVDDYYLNRPRGTNADGGYRIGEGQPEKPVKDVQLTAAIADLTTAWRKGNIQLLAKHTRKDGKIAVYLRGKYQYSLDISDYLDMTRDAFTATRTLRYDLDGVQRKDNTVTTVTGKHIYRDKKDNERTVYVSYVLEKMGEEYYITQVGTAPDRLEDLKPEAKSVAPPERPLPTVDNPVPPSENLDR